MEQPRIAIWRAVSTGDQATPDKDSLEHQDRLNLEHAARWNGVIVSRLEVRESRNIILWEDAREKLDAFAELDDLIRHRKIDILMCYDLTRLARTAALAATVCALCERAGIRIYETTAPPYSLDGPISTPESRIIMLFKIHQAGEETRKFSERASFGRQAQARKGKHANRPPVGLKSTKVINGDKVETVTVIDEEWRPTVELFFQLYVEQGRSQFAIVREFNARGLKTPGGKPWDTKTIRIFLRNRWTYAGYVTWGLWSKTPEKAFRTKAEWDAIITEEMARAAERGMTERAEKPKAAGKPTWFSLILRCEKCNNTLTISRYNKKPGRTRRLGYICRTRCDKSFIRASVVESALRQAILYLQDEAHLEELIGDTPQEHDEWATTLTEAQKAAEGVQRRRKKLTEAYMVEAIALEEYEEFMHELKTEQDDLSRTITSLENKLAANPSTHDRRKRLEEIRDKGMEMLYHPDQITANAWLRQHFVVYTNHHKVTKIFCY